MPEVLDPHRKFIPQGLFLEIETEGRALDSFVDESIKVMLIGAEGSESFVINGAHRVIRESPNLAMAVEWDPHSYRDESRQPSINAMWDFLLTEQDFKASRNCPEDYPGFGHMPKLEPVAREQLFHLPHSDILLKRG